MAGNKDAFHVVSDISAENKNKKKNQKQQQNSYIFILLKPAWCTFVVRKPLFMNAFKGFGCSRGRFERYMTTQEVEYW